MQTNPNPSAKAGKHRPALATAAAALTICLLLTGCWDEKELNTISLVTGVGVDRSQDKEIELTIQTAKMTQSEDNKKKDSGQAKFLLYQESGQNIFSMERTLTHENSRRFFFGHNQFIILGRKEAEHGIRPALDFFLRDSEVRMATWVVVSDTTAKDALNTQSEQAPIPSIELAQLVTAQKINSQTIVTDLLDFTSKLADKTTSPITGIVKLDRASEKPRLTLTGMAVFKKDKMVGEMNSDETRGFLWATNKINGGAVDVHTKEMHASLEIIQAQGDLKPKLQPNGTVSVSVTVHAELGLREADGLDIKKLQQADNPLRQGSMKTIQKNISDCFQKAKQLHADVFGIGRIIEEQHPKEWKQMEPNWDSIYEKITPEIHVETNVLDTGKIADLEGGQG